MKIWFFVLFLVFNLYVSGQTSEQKAYENAKKELAKINKKSLSAEALLNVYKSEIETENQYIEHLSSKIELLEDEQESLQAEYDELSKKLSAQRKQYADLLYFAYKTRHARQAAAYFWAAADYNSAYRRFIYVHFLADFISASTQQIKSLADRVQLRQQEISENIKQVTELTEGRADKMIGLQEKISKQKNYTSTLSKQKKKLAAEVAEKKRKADALRKSVQKTIVSSSKTTSKQPNVKSNTAFSKLKGRLTPPVNGVITSTFGEHKHSVLEYVTTRNDGLEFTVSSESNVAVVADGVVATVLTIPGANTAIIVKHEDFYTVYSNMVKLNVKQGQTLKPGQLLGKVFYKSGAPDSGVFNFQIWHGNEKLNPQAWLTK